MANKQRRSFVVIDNIVYGSANDLVKHSSINQLNSDEKEAESCTKTLDALSLESTVVWQRGQLYGSFALNRFKFRENNAQEICRELVDDLVRDVSAVAERERQEREVKTRERAVENYLASLLPAPLVQRQEVAQMGVTMSTAVGSLKDSSSRLHAAWRIILVTTAQQLNVSYRRILSRMSGAMNEELDLLGFQPRQLLTDQEGILVHLLEERERLHAARHSQHQDELAENRESLAFDEELTNYLVPLASPDDDFNPDSIVRKFSAATMTELREVTDRILDLAVLYLKNATRDVVDSSVSDIKNVLVAESTRL